MAMGDSQDVDYYAVVGVSNTANSNEIRTAYRKASLRVHPDRNPDDPAAVEKFHALNTAFELLLDPIKRAEFDSKRAVKLARAARFEGLDNKRKALARDLEAREEALRKQQEQASEKVAKARKLDEIRAAGARMRQAKEDAARAARSEAPALRASAQPHVTSGTPDSGLDPLECTLRFKWTKKRIPELLDSDSLSARIFLSGLIKPSEIESIVFSPNKPEPSDSVGFPKKGSALVCFKSVNLSKAFLDFAQTDPGWIHCSVKRLVQT